MPTETDQSVVSPHHPRELPSQALLALIGEIARVPGLDLRFCAGITLAMEMADLGSEPGALEGALALVREALVGGYAKGSEFELVHDAAGAVSDIEWQTAFGDDRCADLVLEMMKVDDVDVRRVALEALVVGVTPTQADDLVVTEGAIRRFLGWVGQENRTRH